MIKIGVIGIRGGMSALILGRLVLHELVKLGRS